jgi:hypothetical protein
MARKPKQEVKVGRPSILTPELQQGLVDAVTRTFYLETACDMTGVGRRTVYTWLKRGRREKEGPYFEFRHAIKKAIAQKEANAVESIQAAGADSWQACAWLLERRFPERWSSNRKEIAELRKNLERLEIAIGQRNNSADEASREHG